MFVKPPGENIIAAISAKSTSGVKKHINVRSHFQIENEY
jgi:hypothetical protein